MNPLLIKPAAIAVIVGVTALMSFGAGWFVEHWRQGGNIEKLRGDNAILSSTNGRCVADVRNARDAMAAIQRDAEERMKLADEAVRQAQPKVEERTVALKMIRTLPQVKLDMQCEAIKQEQAEYVAWRKTL